MNAAGMRVGGVLVRSTPRRSPAPTAAKVGKVIRSGMRCSWRSITDTVMRQAAEQRAAAPAPTCRRTARPAPRTRPTVTTSTHSQRDGSGPSGERPAAEDPRLGGHAEPRLRRR